MLHLFLQSDMTEQSSWEDDAHLLREGCSTPVGAKLRFPIIMISLIGWFIQIRCCSLIITCISNQLHISQTSIDGCAVRTQGVYVARQTFALKVRTWAMGHPESVRRGSTPTWAGEKFIRTVLVGLLRLRLWGYASDHFWKLDFCRCKSDWLWGWTILIRVLHKRKLHVVEDFMTHTCSIYHSLWKLF